MSILRIPTARAFQSFLEPSRYKGAHGGRGSGKSHFFAGLGVERCVLQPTRMVCIREVQGSLKDSAKQLIEDKINEHALADQFSVKDAEIRGPNDSIIIFKGMQTFNATNIKSLEGYDVAWVEEAQDLSQTSLDLLRPTIRKDGSELWFSWNPRDEYDAIDRFLRGSNAPKDAIVKQVNWNDNPWFPDVLRQEMERDRAADAAKAAHIWDGEYQQAPSGAYYAELIAKAASAGRVGDVPHNPSLEVHVSFDLGVGQKQVLWFTQRSGRELHVIDYLEGNEEAANEGYSWYARKMRERPYTYARLTFPHDGRVRESNGKSRAETMESLNFWVETLPNTPIEDGIDVVKRTLPLCRFDAEKCKTGLHALKNYRENWDEKLRRSNGPLKDWTNHAADSFRYTCVAYETPIEKKEPKRRYGGETSWMS